MKKNVLDETIKKAVKKILSEISDLAEQVEDPIEGEEGGLAAELEAAGLPAEQVAVVMDVLQKKGLDAPMEEGGMPMAKEPEGQDLNKDGKEGEGEVPAFLVKEDELEEKLKKDSPDRRPSDTPADRLRPLEEKDDKEDVKDEDLKEDMHEEDEEVKEGPAVYMQENWVRKPLNERIYKTLIKKWCK